MIRRIISGLAIVVVLAFLVWLWITVDPMLAIVAGFTVLGLTLVILGARWELKYGL